MQPKKKKSPAVITWMKPEIKKILKIIMFI